MGFLARQSALTDYMTITLELKLIIALRVAFLNTYICINNITLLLRYVLKTSSL